MATGIRLPKDIPVPLRDGYEDTYEETRSTVAMDAGSPRMRNRMRSAPRLFDVVWHMTAAQYKVFDIWFAETVKGGSLPFDLQLLDDTEALVWYTSRFEQGTYRAEISEHDNWRVSARIRAEGDSFATRPSGTDELEGRADMSLSAVGKLVIQVALRGLAELDLSGRGTLKPVPLFGSAVLDLSGRGRLLPRPFYGIATLDLTATGAPQQFGDLELVLQFDAVSYTADAGGAVELQFGPDPYYPPHIV